MPKEQQPYTKNQKLDRFLTELQGSMDVVLATLDAHTDVHKEILTQTTEHNHRMTKMEKWRERMNGGILVAVFVLPTFFGILGWMAYQITTFDKQIQEALSVYEKP